MKTIFSLLTFNCFGGLHWTTPRRLRALGQELDRLAPEVVCLQEVQTHAARRLLQRVCAGHPAHAYVPGRRAPLGSLFTLARAPLSSTLALTGRLAPLQTVNVNSPLSGRIARMAIQYGDVVKAGQVVKVKAGSSEIDASIEMRWRRVLETMGLKTKEWLSNN